MIIVQVAGRLGKDPETRFTPSGQKVTNLNIATTQRKGKEDVTVWVRVTIWGERLDKILSFLKKGSAVIAIGKLNPPTSYTDKEGRTQVSLEMTAEMIEFSPFGREDRSENQTHQTSSSSREDFGSTESNYGGSLTGSGSKSSYGSHALSGHSSQNNHSEDDTLPF